MTISFFAIALATAQLHLQTWQLIGDATFPGSDEKFVQQGLAPAHRCTYKNDVSGELLVLWVAKACPKTLGTEIE